MLSKVFMFLVALTVIVEIFPNSVFGSEVETTGTNLSCSKYVIVVTDGLVVLNKRGLVLAKRVNGSNGLILEENVKLDISNNSRCVPSDSMYSYFVARSSENGVYSCIFEVFEKAEDSFKDVKRYFKKNAISSYEDNYDVTVIWLPSICEFDLSVCQEELNFMRDHEEIWKP